MGTNASKVRILLVEGDPDQRFVLARSLTKAYGERIQLTPASSIADASRQLQREEPDCILLDPNLPDASGEESVEKLRRATAAAIVVLTPQDDLGVRCLRAGAQDFLRKGETSNGKLSASIDRAVAGRAAVREQVHLAAIVNSAPDAIFVRALDGTVLTWNAAAERIYGYSADEIVGKHYEAFVPESRREREEAITELLVAGREIPPYETVRVRKDGSLVDISVTHAAITDESDLVVGISHIARDITAEKTIRRERDVLAGIVNSSLGAIIAMDTEGVIESWNLGAEHLFGYTSAEAVGRPATLLAARGRAHEMRDLLERLLKGERVVGLETLIQAKDGTLIDVRITANPITDDAGRVVGVAAIYNDVTERKRLEEQLIQSQKMEALGGLAGGIAHDFNNLLAVILNYGRFIHADLPEDHPARDDIEEMIGAAQRGATLVRQLLSFARREVVRPEPINLNLLVEQMQPLLKRAIAEDIELDLALGETWNTEADKGQVEQLLLNLVVNARDAMPEGGRITIETSNVVADEVFVANRPAMSPGRYVGLAVSDTGTGMDKEIQARIFEPFFTTKARGSGTGLGLASAYGIVQRAGGDISVDSEPGFGTTFKIYLPVSEVATGRTRLLRPDAAALTGRGERVLVVEDDDSVLELIGRVLKEGNYRPIPMSSPQLALEYLAGDSDVDLLLTDVILPEMSGPTLSEMTTLPTVFMSGYTDSVVAEQGVLQEGVVFLPKPFTGEDLLHIVRATLDQGAYIDLTEDRTTGR